MGFIMDNNFEMVGGLLNMKKLIALMAAVMLLFSAALAEVETIDLQNMTYEELTALSVRVKEAIKTAAAQETGEYPATREEPALIGAAARYDGSFYLNTAVTDVTVLEVIRGDAAWQKIYAWNNYNEKAGAGEEYILVKVRAQAVAAQEGERAEIYDYDFAFVSAEGAAYEYAYAAGVDRDLTAVYEGASTEGWVIGKIKKGDKPLLVYLMDADQPLWFDLVNRAPVTLDEDKPLPTLMRGDINEDVRAMQQALIDMGYLDGAADGNFGRKTEAAVSAYQADMGLAATGIADSATLKLILSYEKP